MKKYLLFLFISITSFVKAQEKNTFDYLDVFELEYISDPQISPQGDQVIYVRNYFDIMDDKRKGDLWIYDIEDEKHYKLTNGSGNEYAARWSPNADRIAYISSTEQGSELFMYWTKTGTSARISRLEKSPGNLSWSPDGQWLSFSMQVEEKEPVIAKMPEKPKGAEWAGTARITDRLKHEADGRGYLSPGYSHIFLIPANGGSPRQLTNGDFNHGGEVSWSPDGNSIYFSANRNDNWEYDFRNSEIYRLDLKDLNITALTNKKGPDDNPVVSPDGKTIAFRGFEDQVQTYQTEDLFVMDIDGQNMRSLTDQLDRSVFALTWNKKGDKIYFMYDDKGNTKIAYTDLKGNIKTIAHNLGGTSVGRPYGGGSYSVSAKERIAYTYTTPEHPAELALSENKANTTVKVSDLNSDLLGHKELGAVEEVWYKSSVDGRDLQGWLVKPPYYEEGKNYPLIVENHGGPISNYGDRFSAEMQLYASAGYMVFYPNPRGSTSYGEEFGNLLYNNYPGDDYQDVMDGVDHLIKEGLASEDQLFVTGGSAGGIMTAWIIGKNNRFEAAVVAKPVMNWISKTLTADNYYGYANYRYPGQPWENFDTYWKFSPISLVGNIETPTMVMVGMEDLRTPPSEAKQLYHALKLREKETVLVEIPKASHGIANRPSNLISKIAHTVAWFDKYRK
ncbi:S9 family peptidase [Robertkochia marina]|uniref:S9 family peptidase n=1 Tax=Robertkochia marina TaxID=1227945 RepID=A0A4S3M3T8_9FLAO|nr:S9 family peptidase [Robertkochia marina]THD69852.1 S9 family peptidase [Robertkochia marina]TRZ46803.1 S9 family peptidase [Robertkochia marina]